MGNPKVMEAMGLMQTDPEEAQRRYKSDPDIANFLKEFSSLMATHFDVLSKDAPKSSTPAAPPKQIASSGYSAPPVQEKSQELLVMEDPEVQEAFRDPEVQKLLGELRAGRQLEMHDLARSNPRVMHRVKVLLDKG